MKQVNIKFKEQRKIEGPFYFLEGVQDFELYWETVRIPRFLSAADYIISARKFYKLPLNKIDHLLNKHRLDYGEQTSICDQIQQLKKNSIQVVESLMKKVHKDMKKSVEQHQTLIVNEFGKYQVFDKTKMKLTDKKIIANTHEIDITKAVFNFNTDKKHHVLILENDNNLTLELKDKMWDNFKGTISNTDQIYYFNRITTEQLKEVKDRIMNQYTDICFETTFFNTVQLQSFIKLILNIPKALNFYIYSFMDVMDVIEEYCSVSERKVLSKHTFIMM